MKKTFFVSLASFVLGTTIAVLLIANPFHWPWMHQAGQRLVGEAQTSTAGESSTQLWTCPMHPEVLEEEPGNCPICAMKLTPVKDASEHAGDSQKQLYTCSMHPRVLQDEPGNCPICAMKLTPVKGSPLDGRRPRSTVCGCRAITCEVSQPAAWSPAQSYWSRTSK